MQCIITAIAQQNASASLGPARFALGCLGSSQNNSCIAVNHLDHEWRFLTAAPRQGCKQVKRTRGSRLWSGRCAHSGQKWRVSIIYRDPRGLLLTRTAKRPLHTHAPVSSRPTGASSKGNLTKTWSPFVCNNRILTCVLDLYFTLFG